MNAGSLFSGVGMLDLAIEACGFTVAWQVEREPYCQAVLARHWPDVPRHGDIKELNPHALHPVDLVFGGPPCQPFSQAGRRRVVHDDRWLWPHFARVVRALRPHLVFVEAPAGLLSAWRDDGRFRPAPVEEVLGDLAALGFDAQWACLRASEVGAPHERGRVFILAYTGWVRDRRARLGAGHGGQADLADPQGEQWDQGGPAPTERPGRLAGGRAVADALGQQPQRAGVAGELAGASGAGAVQGPQRQRHGDAAGDRGEAMADPQGAGRRPGLRQAGQGPGRPSGEHLAEPGDRRDPLADADGAGPPRRANHPAADARQAAPGRGPELPEPRLGRSLDGAAAGLDGHRWPAPPGPPHAWEPPRTVAPRSVPNRTARLTALGNGAVPQQAAAAFRLLWGRMLEDVA